MFNTTNGYSLSDIAAVTNANSNRTNSGDCIFGENSWWIIFLFLIFGFGNGFGQRNTGGYPCATQPDVRAAVDQQTILSKLDGQTYGIADSTYALNNSINTGFNGVDKAICNLGYQTQAGLNELSHQMAACCCDTKAAILDNKTQGIINTSALQSAIAENRNALEKANMQTRFDMQAYNCNVLQAIDKMGDRVIDYMTQDKIASLTAENQALKFAASQSAQNSFIAANQEAQTATILRRLETPCPIPAYVVPNPNCCYSTPCINSCAYGYSA